MRMPRTATFLGIKDAAIYLTSLDPDGGWTVSRINYYTFDSKRGKPIQKRRDRDTMNPQKVGQTLVWTKRQLNQWLKHNRWSDATKDELAFTLPDVCAITGLTDEQVFYQVETGTINPQIVGRTRVYTLGDIARLNLVSKITQDANVLADRVAASVAGRSRSAGTDE